MHGGDGDLGGVIARAALNSEGDDLLRGLMALGAHVLLGLADDARGLVGHFGANVVEQLLVGVLAGEVGDALEFRRLALVEVVELAGATVELTLLAGELVLALVQNIVAAVEGLLALHDAVLEGADLGLALLVLGLCRLAVLEDLFLGLEQRLLLQGFRGPPCIAHDLLSLGVCGLHLAVRLTDAAGLRAAHGNHGDDDPEREADDADSDFHGCDSLKTSCAYQNAPVSRRALHLPEYGHPREPDLYHQAHL